MTTALFAAGALLFGGGLRADFPDDAPTLAGVELDLKYFLLQEAWIGLSAAWGGGADDRNPERVLISQRVEVSGLLGARLGDEDFGALVGARAGAFRAQGFPRGPLPRIYAWGPLVGAETGVYIRLGDPWGHPLWLEPRGGWSTARIEGEWIGVPWFGVALSARLDTP